MDVYSKVFNVVGVSYRTLPLEGRERLARLGMKSDFDLRSIAERMRLEEAALLSTCNRFEIVNVGRDSESDLVDFLSSELAGGAREGVYALRNADAVRHVFRVASSLDSMVVGEPQILGQVKDSYRKSVDCGLVGSHLHHLFQFSFRLAKKVRENTRISEKGVSISYVAVRLAQQIFGDLSASRVLIIGSGKMAELAALHLKSYGCKHIVVANRTVERASDLASRIGGAAVSLEEISREIASADVVIGSIAIDRPLVETASVRKLRRTRPLFLIDLGVPRNFQATLGELDNVYLYDIDDLAAIADDNKALREESAREAEIIIEYGLFQFERWLTKISSQSEVTSFRGRVLEICEREIAKALSPHVEASKLAEMMPDLSHRISQKISHDLTKVLSNGGTSQLDPSALLPFIFDDILKVM